MNELDQAERAVADPDHGLRAARAEVARLTLAVRAAQRDAERTEAEATELDDRARRAELLLQQSLDALVEDRRRERQADLARERAALPERPQAAPAASLATSDDAAPEVVTGPEAWEPQPSTSAAVVPVEELHQVVQAAVAAGLREAMEQAVATMHLVPALSRHAIPELPRSAPAPVVEVGEERPLVRRFLYLDVLLPLVAALVVIVLALAWIG